MSESETERVTAAIVEVCDAWEGQYHWFGEKAPGHHIVGQILAVLPAGAELEYVDARISDADRVEDFDCEVVIYTRDLLLRSTLRPGQTPELAVVARRQVVDLTVTAAPHARPYTGGYWDPYSVLVDYPRFSLALPLTQSRAASGRVGEFLPSLVEDVRTGRD